MQRKVSRHKGKIESTIITAVLNSIKIFYATHHQKRTKTFDMIKHKKYIGIVFSVFISLFGGFILMQSVSAEPEMTVYKSPTCGCCNKWIKHMEDNGFIVNAVDVAAMSPVKEKFGIHRQIASCHTAVVDGYIIEGHVSALDVRRLLTEKPDVVGLTVPGMPIGSPGMEVGDKKDRYAVLSIQKDGNTTIFSQY